MTCGIYALVFEGTDKLYIGQSIRIEVRYAEHKRSMKEGTTSIKLRKAYKDYGVPTLEVLHICIPEDLEAQEVYYTNLFNSIDDGFNTILGSPRYGTLRCVGRSKHGEEAIVSAMTSLLNPLVSIDTVAANSGISKRTLQGVVSGLRHPSILAKYPELLTQVLDARKTYSKNKREVSLKEELKEELKRRAAVRASMTLQ